MEGHRTATYCAVLQKGGQLLFGIGDMDIHSQITPEYVSIMQVWLRQIGRTCNFSNAFMSVLPFEAFS